MMAQDTQLSVATWNIRTMAGESTPADAIMLDDQESLTGVTGRTSDIIFIQETRLKTKATRLASNTFHKYDCLWSCYDDIPPPTADPARKAAETEFLQDPDGQAKHGVGILVRKSSNAVSNLRPVHHLPGRHLLATAEVRGVSTLIVCVYAPASGATQHRCNYLDLLQAHIEEHMHSPDAPDDPARPIIIAGDFNIRLSNEAPYTTKRDPGPLTTEQKHFGQFVRSLDLTESWTEANGDLPLMTHSQPHCPASRIDYVFTSTSFEFAPKSATFATSRRSDHAAVRVDFQHPSHQKRSPPPFRLSSRVLAHPVFGSYVAYQAHLADQAEDPLTAWEVFKANVQSQAIHLAARLTKADRDAATRLSRGITAIRQALSDGTITDEVRARLEDELSGLKEAELDHRQLRIERDRTHWHRFACLENERSTKLFYALEKDSQKAQTIAKLTVVEDGVPVDKTDPVDITDALVDFYGKLYAAEPVDDTAVQEILETLQPAAKVSNDEKQKLAADLTPQEVAGAIDAMPKGKSPGSDGLTAAFYTRFSSKLSPLLAKVANQARETGLLPPSLRIGYVKVLYKKGARNEVRNYRPISLLNVDSKIISRALVSRFYSTLSDIVPLNQNGFVPQRTIDANIHLLRDVLSLTKATKTPGVAVLLDSEKAFDRVSHEFLFRALAAYGVGDGFVQWMKLLNTGCQSHVTYNGVVSLPFTIGRSVRQGSVEAPFLYAIYAGAICDYVTARMKERFLTLARPKGLPLVLRPSLFADDTTVFLKSTDDLDQLFETYQRVGQASNLLLNKAKTTLLRLGPTRKQAPPQHLAELDWVPADGTTRALGIQLGYGDQAKANFAIVVEKIERALARWAQRGLSITGRALIANSIGLSRAWYQCRFLHTPTEYISKLERIIDKFMWPKRYSPVSRAVMAWPMDSAGLGLNVISVRTNAKAWLAMAIANLCSPMPGDWKEVVQLIAVHADRKAPGSTKEYTALQRLLAPVYKIPQKLSDFWHHAFKAWRALEPSMDQPHRRGQAMMAPLWHNPALLRQDNGKPLSLDKWRKAGVSYVHQIIGEDHKPKPLDEIAELLPNVPAHVLKNQHALVLNTLKHSGFAKIIREDARPETWSYVTTIAGARTLVQSSLDSRGVKCVSHYVSTHGQVRRDSRHADDYIAADLLVPAIVVRWSPDRGAPDDPPPSATPTKAPRTNYLIGARDGVDVDTSAIKLNGISNNMFPTGTRLFTKHMTLKTLRRLLTPAPEPSPTLCDWVVKIGAIAWHQLKRTVMSRDLPRNRAVLVWRIAHQTEWTGERKLNAARENLPNKERRKARLEGEYACAHCFQATGALPTETWQHILIACPLAEAVWRVAAQVFLNAQNLPLPTDKRQRIFGPLKSLCDKDLRRHGTYECLTIVLATARWALWTLRCRATFDNVKLTPTDAENHFKRLITAIARRHATAQELEKLAVQTKFVVVVPRTHRGDPRKLLRPFTAKWGAAFILQRDLLPADQNLPLPELTLMVREVVAGQSAIELRFTRSS